MPICPICKKPKRDLLKHLRIAHEITNTEEYQIQLDKIENSERRKDEFRDFVSKLKEQKVSAEQYRESVEKWFEEHPEE
jgi:hypothetical protein